MTDGDQLASPTTTMRKLFPRVLLAVVLLAPVSYLLDGRAGVSAEHVAIWFALAAALAIYCVVMSSFADYVADHGDHLLVRRGKSEQRLEFAGIACVEDGHGFKPHRVTLHLKVPGPFGRRVAFMPRATAFGRNEVALELARRIDPSREAT